MLVDLVMYFVPNPMTLRHTFHVRPRLARIPEISHGSTRRKSDLSGARTVVRCQFNQLSLDDSLVVAQRYEYLRRPPAYAYGIIRETFYERTYCLGRRARPGCPAQAPSFSNRGSYMVPPL